MAKNTDGDQQQDECNKHKVTVPRNGYMIVCGFQWDVGYNKTNIWMEKEQMVNKQIDKWVITKPTMITIALISHNRGEITKSKIPVETSWAWPDLHNSRFTITR